MNKKIDIALSEILIAKGLITKEALAPIMQEADSSGQGLQPILIKNGLFSAKEILGLFGEKFNLTCVDLKAIQIAKAVTDKVPAKIASYYGFMPVDMTGRVLTVAAPYPLDVKTQDEIRAQLGYDVKVALAPLNDIADALNKFYGLASETLEKIVSQSPKSVDSAFEESQSRIVDIEKLAGDASVIRLVNQIILEAWRKRATDIHIEPYRQGVSLRYRIDGVLYESNMPPEIKSLLNAIISRIKIMSNLNIVERRLPQDGRAVVKVQDQVLDLRISTLPTHFGESVVIRILPSQMLFSIEKLGLAKEDLDVFERLLQKPHGIIFVTGPTGSGKTTTLYACLSKINTKDRKIITIEDPIEYEIGGLTQIQVMPEIGLDFARGLRSCLRHDPDVMMVGEVRDLETAEIAIRVALTGHLVFSTVHTNDAASGITRLVDIGLEPYLIASSVEAFIAQRLIRMICLDCKYEDKKAPAELKEMIARDLGIKADGIKIFRGKGCPSCNYTGFFGRKAIYEILVTDDVIKDLIIKKVSSGEIKKAAVSRGMRTLRQDGWQKVVAGLTVPEEVMEVTSAENNLGLVKAMAGLYENYTGASREGASEEDAVSRHKSDNRAFMRLDKKVNLRYRTIKTQEELKSRGSKMELFSATKNISAGGLLFVSNEALPIASILELNIELPDGEPEIMCLARVVRIGERDEKNSYDAAVCFLDITGAQRGRLKKFIEGYSE
jgi:Type II secretory pathway, ATPase PulE/Tfp pilus assembly pathway, ATPase PilB